MPVQVTDLTSLWSQISINIDHETISIHKDIKGNHTRSTKDNNSSLSDPVTITSGSPYTFFTLLNNPHKNDKNATCNIISGCS